MKNTSTALRGGTFPFLKFYHRHIAANPQQIALLGIWLGTMLIANANVPAAPELHRRAPKRLREPPPKAEGRG